MKSSVVNPLARAYRHTQVHHLPDADTSVNLTTNAVLTNIATTGSALKHARNAVKEPPVMASSTIVLNVNVLRDTSDQLSENADQNVTVTLIVPDQDQLASMEFVRIHVTVLAVSMLIVIFVD